MNDLSHLDKNGNPKMVDVGEKAITQRLAIGRTQVILPANVLELFAQSDIQTKKGPVFQTAILAGIMAAKKTSDLIPLCHPLFLNKCDVTIKLKDNVVTIDCTVGCSGKTGVEMEALTGSSIAALTIYDMCKALSHDIVIKETRLIHKSGGKNDYTSG